MISSTLWKSYFAFYLREVWNHIGSEVTKRDDRAFPSPDLSRRLLANFVHLLARGGEETSVPALVYPRMPRMPRAQAAQGSLSNAPH